MRKVVVVLALLLLAVPALAHEDHDEGDSAAVVADEKTVRLAAAYDGGLPYIITAGGELLLPAADSTWQAAPLDVRVNDVFSDAGSKLWAATDDGLYLYNGRSWRQMDDHPAYGVEVTHGHVVALCQGHLVMVHGGGGWFEPHVHHEDSPLPDQPASELVMLGDHSHALLIGGQVFNSLDLGLSWTSLEAPAEVGSIWTNADGNLIAAAADGLFTWDRVDKLWSEPIELPGDDPAPRLRLFREQVYALSGGQLYRLAGEEWQPVELPQVSSITALEYQYPNTLWALDGEARWLLSTTDGAAWTSTEITVKAG